MEVTNIQATGNPSWTCINLMALTQRHGCHKWNNIFSIKISIKMKLNYKWEIFTWTKSDGSGGSGIKNAIQGG